ncbi:MAG: hypothetical protein ACFB6R_06060 [Alphaproteobacteria bacterium]
MVQTTPTLASGLGSQTPSSAGAGSVSVGAGPFGPGDWRRSGTASPDTFVRRLWPMERPLICAHLLRLAPDDRRRRFGRFVSVRKRRIPALMVTHDQQDIPETGQVVQIG